MDTKTRKFAIKEAIKLVSTQSIENKALAVIDMANMIVAYLDSFEAKPEPSPMTMPLTYPPNYPQWVSPPAVSPYWTTPINNPFEVTCNDSTSTTTK